MEVTFAILAERVLNVPVLPGDTEITSGAAVRLILARMPKLFDAVLVNENKEQLEGVAAEIIRLLAISVDNLDPGVRFSQSPEYKEAVQRYQSRLSSGSQGGTVELIAR